jgi:signal peptidase I
MSKAKNSSPKDAATEHVPGRGTRETIESIVIAIILAFLFRAFEAEAFVIPTGSMAPTLQGQHIELPCPKCGYWYRSGNSDGRSADTTTCPLCRFENRLTRDSSRKIDEVAANTYSGDRILVSKFAYDLPGAEPQRWDVIVFKFPGNAKINYIKRLIGLPGEKIRIRQGNIYVKHRDDGEDADFRIARKTEHSPAKLKAMLQLVHDTDFASDELLEAGWPSRWQELAAADDKPAWTGGPRHNHFATDGQQGESWLMYRHLIPSQSVWLHLDAWNTISSIDDLSDAQEFAASELLNMGSQHSTEHTEDALEQFDANGDGVLDLAEKQAALQQQQTGELIGDFYAYNAPAAAPNGENWVGDLALEADVDVKSDEGAVLLRLVRAGSNYDCRIDVATGRATLSIDGGLGEFSGSDGKSAVQPTAENCGLQGPGRYQVRFANVDNELVLWVNDQPVAFDGPTTYSDQGAVEPLNEAPGDLAPVGIGSDGAALELTRLKVQRDVYYLDVAKFHWNDDSGRNRGQVDLPFDEEPNPGGYLGDDQYLPMGDNSPQSMDSRLWRVDESRVDGRLVRDWTIPTSVSRRMLLGKALFIYWPHPWNGFVPNFARMGFIR